MKERLDVLIVKKNLVESRSKAQELINNGKVIVNGKIIKKSSEKFDEDVNISIDTSILRYVSRAGLKLEGAINSFGLDFKGKKVIDIGSSTGGFTDCALKHGAEEVISVDVGSNQMHESLRREKKVKLFENTDIRNLNKEIVENTEIAVMDVSFISVTKIIEVIKDYPNLKEIVCLIKPQFECGKEIAAKYKGIILDKKVHLDVINKVVSSFKENGFYLYDLDVSKIKGGDGNIEYVSYFTKIETKKYIDFTQIVERAFEK